MEEKTTMRFKRNEQAAAAGDQFCPPANAIYDPPEYVINDIYHQQVVPVVHTIETINQHHCVPVYHHIYEYKTKDVMCTGFRGIKKK